MAEPITELLQAWSEGSPDAADRLFPLVYRQLRAIARRRVAGEGANYTLRPTELVHEAYLRMVSSGISARDRAHFYAICAQVMRRILIDRARQQVRAKHGGGAAVVSLDDVDVAATGSPEKVLAINQALEKLEAIDERKSRAIEMVVFGGLELDMAAEVLGISNATLRRELKVAKAWLYQSLCGPAPPPA
jgi:RNA polymerase sigma factor (TIGR02999 family)